MLDTVFAFTAGLLEGLAGLLHPLAGADSTALAIIVLTLAVRVLLLPLTLLSARGQRTQIRLAPQLERLRKRHGKDPERLYRETRALYAKEGSSPFAASLPLLAQSPFFVLLSHAASVSGAHTLFGAPLGEQLVAMVAGFGLFSWPVLVFVGVLALMAAVAWTMARRARLAAVSQPAWLRRTAAVMPYGTVVFAAFFPLAAALYLLTTTAWTAMERAVIYPRPVAVGG